VTFYDAGGKGAAAANSLAKATEEASGGMVPFDEAGGTGGAAANSLAKAAVEASGGTVPFYAAGGKGAAAASSRAHASWRNEHVDAACKKGCGRLFDNHAKGAPAHRKRHQDGDGKGHKACAGLGQPKKAGLFCGKCGFCGKVGHEWTDMQQKERHEETCPGRVAGGHDCTR